MKKVFLILVILLVALLFMSCAATTLRDKVISSMYAAMYEVTESGGISQYPADYLMPGKTYQLKVIVYTADGETIDDPDYNDLGFFSPNNSLLNFQRVNNRTVHALANPESFDFVDGTQFELSIKVANNPFEEVYSWAVDWNGFNVMDFSGSDGKSGTPGYNGANGIDGEAGENGTNGESGTNGTSGTDGGDAIDVVFDIAYYYVGDTIPGVSGNMLVYYDRVNSKLYLTRVQNITIDATGGQGGDGGKGGDGGNGGDGGPATESSETRGGDGGNGGNGGNAGDGGEGGNVTVHYKEGSDVINYIDRKQTGGESGDPGRGGDGGRGGQGSDGTGRTGSDGNAGNPGKDGKDGDFVIRSHTSFEDMFQGVNHPKFDRSKLN